MPFISLSFVSLPRQAQQFIPPRARELASHFGYTLNSIRITAAHARIDAVEIRGDRLILTRRREPILLDGRHPRLLATDPAGRLREAAEFLKRA